MKAIVYHKHGLTTELQYQDIAEPVLGSNDVLIRVRAVSLNGFDPMMLAGSTSLRVPLPMSPCGDFSGEIVAFGHEVEGNWKIGDRVCPYPLIEGKGMMGETITGACREYVTVPASNLLGIPDDVSFEDAAALPVAYGTALRMMQARGKIEKGERVLILGATGGVGVCCVQLAVAAGAEVIACGSAEWKLQKLINLGASVVIDTSKDDFLPFVWEKYGKPRFSGEGGIDVVVNYIGGNTWVPSLKVLRKGGRMLVCGATAGYSPTEDLRYIWSFELNILGSNGWAPSDQLKLLQMVSDGELDPVIHGVRPMEQTALSMQELIDRRIVGKLIMTL